MIDSEERVILVSASDIEIGTAPKLEVHTSGLLHRAFSVFVVDEQGRVLLQQRAVAKYHSPGLWSNTCCGHPRPGELTIEAARRRLGEEMGVSCDLEPLGTFIYSAQLGDNLVEHELDHVFAGRIPHCTPAINPAELDDWRWCDMGEIYDGLHTAPAMFTAWFRAAF